VRLDATGAYFQPLAGRHRVQPNSSQQQREDPEESCEARHRAFLIEGQVNQMLHRSHAGDRQVRVYVRQRLGEHRLERAG
jgi:hypothetical protein